MHPFPKSKEEMEAAASEVVADTSIDLGIAQKVYQSAVTRQQQKVAVNDLAERMAEQVIISLSELPEGASWERVRTVIRQVGMLRDVAQIILHQSQQPCECVPCAHDEECWTGKALEMLALLGEMERQRQFEDQVSDRGPDTGNTG